MNDLNTMCPRSATQVVAMQNALIHQVYAWMGAGLVITAFMALITLSSPAILNALDIKPIFYGLMIDEPALVLTLSFLILLRFTGKKR